MLACVKELVPDNKSQEEVHLGPNPESDHRRSLGSDRCAWR